MSVNLSGTGGHVLLKVMGSRSPVTLSLFPPKWCNGDLEGITQSCHGFSIGKHRFKAKNAIKLFAAKALSQNMSGELTTFPKLRQFRGKSEQLLFQL